MALKEGDMLSSSSLLGIKREHQDHPDFAEMESTGKIRFRAIHTEDGSDPKDWFLEFKCDVCGYLIYQAGPQDRDLIRDVLRANGITPK